jgi:uncharacterized membrane protein
LAAARQAGLKRLLKDNGYKIAAIDGKPDKTADAALKDFHRHARLLEQATNGQLFSALEREAGKKGQAPQGLTLCNDAKEDVAAAVGDASDVSRGWWRIGSGGCARLITTPLSGNTIWLFAQRPGGPVLVSGPDFFCTTPKEFEIHGRSACAGRGLTQTGFARLAVKSDGAIIHLGENGIQSGILK